MKKNYILIDEIKTGDIFTEIYTTAKEAKAAAKNALDKMTEYDKRRRSAFYILVNDDPESLDGDILKEYL